MAKFRRRSASVQTWVDVDLDDFDEDVILEYAEEIQKRKRKPGVSGPETGGLDYGALTLSFGSWQALKLRDAVALGRAYEALDLLREVMGEKELAA